MCAAAIVLPLPSRTDWMGGSKLTRQNSHWEKQASVCYIYQNLLPKPTFPVTVRFTLPTLNAKHVGCSRKLASTRPLKRSIPWNPLQLGPHCLLQKGKKGKDNKDSPISWCAKDSCILYYSISLFRAINPTGGIPWLEHPDSFTNDSKLQDLNYHKRGLLILRQYSSFSITVIVTGIYTVIIKGN